MDTRKKIFLIIFSLAIIIGIVLLVISFVSKEKEESVPYYKTLIRNEKIVASNPDFASGEKLLAEGKAEEAIPSLEKALKEVKVAEDEAYIKYALALSYSSTRKTSDEYKKSIPLFKEIIAHPKYPIVIKAQSIEAIDRLLYSSVSREAREIITNSEPYSSFAQGNDIRALRKNLLDYGKLIYSLAGIEIKLAALHAQDLFELSQQVSQTDNDSLKKARIEQEKKLITQTIDNAALRLQVQTNDAPNLKVYIPENLLFKAIAAQYFFWATNSSPFGEPEALYKDALKASDENYKPHRPLIEYHYAVFLASIKDEKRYQDIKNLLLPYGKPEASKAYMTGVFRKEKDNIIGEKKNLVLLANIDPQFKTYLLGLGWTEADFLQN